MRTSFSVAPLGALLLILSAGTSPLLAQGRGRLVGRILDASTAVPLSGAQVVLVENPTNVVAAALDGRYTLMNVPAGPVSIRVRMIGYQSKVIAGLAMSDGGIVVQDVALSAQLVEVEALTVSAGAEAGSVDAALEKQRTATNIVNAVTAEQIARSPDSDAGQAVQRVSGVSVQDGKFVFVRGLGERYTTTSLNGARVPSPEPERKVVPLDLFPSGLLEGVTTSKTFTPDQPGDFSGAAVNLQTREFPAGRVVTLSSTMGMNGAVAGHEGTYAPTLGTEWRASAGGARALPTAAASVGTGSTPNQAMSSFRRVWQGEEGSGAPNGSFSASVGGEDPVFGRLIGYIASFTYSNAQEVRHDERRAVAIAYDTVMGGETSLAQNAYLGTTTRNSVLWGGMLNLSARIGSSSKLSLNNTYTRGGDNEAISLSGLNEEFGPLAQTRLQYTMRTVRSNQLSGEHLFGMRHSLEWQVTNSGVRRYEPDRSDYVQEGTRSADGTVTPVRWWGQSRSAVRTFSDLEESGWTLGTGYRYSFGEPGVGPWIKVGANLRTADREARSQAFDIINAALSDAERAVTPAEIFSDAHIAANSFVLISDNQVGDYTASDRIGAGFVMAEFPLTSRIRLVGGARVEDADLEVITTLPGQAPTTARLATTDVLPSLALNIGLTDDQNLRLSASQTLSRPEYRELSGSAYRDIVGGLTVFGNPDLKRALIQNYDLRWEWFPRAGEILSLGAFYKRFERPIEKVLVGTTGANALTYINARSGRNFGVELEVRKNFGFLGDRFLPFSAFSNVTVMDSKVMLSAEDLGASNAVERPMLGQSPYVVNAGLGWNSGVWSATLLYNIVGRRVVEGGSTLVPDAYEEARGVVDASLRFPIGVGFEGRFDAKNLLDSPYRTTQGVLPDGSDNERLRYTAGRVFQVGVQYRP
jgi:outer membrane receptor protein involved in Fe transport